jgi:hypothetical protein
MTENPAFDTITAPGPDNSTPDTDQPGTVDIAKDQGSRTPLRR